MPVVLLSDSSAEQDLIDDGGDDVDGVYVTSPIALAEFRSEKAADHHSMYGDRAFAIVEALIEEASTTLSVDAVDQTGGFLSRMRRLLGDSKNSRRSQLADRLDGGSTKRGSPVHLDRRYKSSIWG
jgi:hypothetical protein